MNQPHNPIIIKSPQDYVECIAQLDGAYFLKRTSLGHDRNAVLIDIALYHIKLAETHLKAAFTETT